MKKKNKEGTINPINKKYNKCFQYVVTIALYHEEMKKDLQIIATIKPLTGKCNWEGIGYPPEKYLISIWHPSEKYPSKKDDWKKFEKNNLTIALNVLYTKNLKIYYAYASKHNSNCEKQVIILMIPNGKRWY